MRVAFRCILHLVNHLRRISLLDHSVSNKTRIVLMSNVAVMLSGNCVSAPMSSHFGKAEWIMTADTESHTMVFLENEPANGKSVVELIVGQNCTDAIFTEIGDGALRHLQSANIHGWMAPANITGRQALEMFEHLRLHPAASAADGHGGHECCCAKKAGSEASPCCHS